MNEMQRIAVDVIDNIVVALDGYLTSQGCGLTDEQRVALASVRDVSTWSVA